MDLRMLREAEDRVLQRRKNSNNHYVDLLTEFMDWLQDNEHINKSKEYRRELCELFLTTRKSGEEK